LAAAVKDHCGLECELISSGGGVFEVEMDGKLVFSKKELDRFPEHDEILGLIPAGK
jgi:selT/selW/selH-like putative selenoprotein